MRGGALKHLQECWPVAAGAHLDEVILVSGTLRKQACNAQQLFHSSQHSENPALGSEVSSSAPCSSPLLTAPEQ